VDDGKLREIWIQAMKIDLDPTDWRILDALQTDAGVTNQDLAERVHVSPATCLRRVKRLRDAGLIERQVAVLSADRLAQTDGALLTAIVEVTLEVQSSEQLAAFEAHALQRAEVQQLYRVSPGPDFVLILTVRDMPHYQAAAEQLFTAHANVRNVRAFFVTRRARLDTRLPLPGLNA
jgi:Lrp/AsnC family transcriptional regulator, leucine-responsive regulatory protein